MSRMAWVPPRFLWLCLDGCWQRADREGHPWHSFLNASKKIFFFFLILVSLASYHGTDWLLLVLETQPSVGKADGLRALKYDLLKLF